jgi:hypothetical protein
MFMFRPSAAGGEAKCDGSGNLFFEVDMGGSILEISKDGTRNTAYAMSQSSERPDGDGVQVMDFAVSPSGKVYELVQSSRETAVIDFDLDGSVNNKTKLSVPEHVEGRQLAVFDDSAVLFAGFYTKLAPQDRRGKSFAALFDPSGKLRKQLTGYPDANLAELSKKIPDGALTIGQDGRAYLLSSDKILVVSESGEVIRRIPFRKMDRETSAVRLDVAEGLLSITFEKFAENRMATRT